MTRGDTTPAPARRRQLGAERRTRPLPVVPEAPSATRVTLGRVALVATVLAWLAYVLTTVVRLFLNGEGQGFRFTMESVSYVVVVTFLTFSALMYLLARQGALERFRRYSRVPRAELDAVFADDLGPDATGVTVLVPSYAEEPAVVRATLWSAALQEFPSIRVVLLVDDPPRPSRSEDAVRLAATRAVPAEIAAALAAPHRRFTAALQVAQLERELRGGEAPVPPVALADLVGHYRAAVAWLVDLAAATPQRDHVDRFFAVEVAGGLAGDLHQVADAVTAAAAEGAVLDHDRWVQLLLRLVRIFGAEVTRFERKAWVSLSHEANKAMNINAYLSLMGGAYRQEAAPDGTALVPCAPEAADLAVPDTEFVLTLDADSLLLREYCLRLVHLLRQPGNERIAVAQTPYSAFRGAATRIERLAGATTDIQHLLHQGLTRWGATFWVGANAVIRKRALDDVVELDRERGWEIKRYVQDRTVVEDTESSIDLGLHGWTLMNFPERLSYSATPPDFGSLVVQRRRWANGGLIILPKFLQVMRARRRSGDPVPFAEALLRINYLASIAWASFGLLFLLAFPYDSRLLSPLVLAAALPYFLAMASDLKACGYRRSDVIRIYGFNLILLPVNLAGVAKSLQQTLTGRKIPFARTPKVADRTAVPVLHVVAPYLVVAFSVLTVVRNVEAQNWANAGFAALNATLAGWAILAYIGVAHSIVDVVLGVVDWMYVAPRGRRTAEVVDGSLDWRTVLHDGAAPGTPARAPRPQHRQQEEVSAHGSVPA